MSLRPIRVAFACIFVSSAFAQEELLIVVEHGPHHAVIERVSSYFDNDGNVASVTNQFVQVENGSGRVFKPQT